MKYNVFDKDDHWLGTVHGSDPQNALEKAIDEFGMTTADHVEERDDDVEPHGRG